MSDARERLAQILFVNLYGAIQARHPHGWEALAERDRDVFRCEADKVMAECRLMPQPPAELLAAVREADDTRYCDGRCDEMGCRGHEPDEGLLSDHDHALLALGRHVAAQMEPGR